MVTRIRQLSSLFLTAAALSALAGFATATEPAPVQAVTQPAAHVLQPGPGHRPLIIWWPPALSV